MLEPDPSFRPVRTRDGYLPLEDLGLIGDGSTVAMAGLDGSIRWLCLPRFDSEPLLCGLRLSAGGGLLYRYLHDDSPDGIAGDEGAFVLCSFWLADNLAMQGRLDEAEELYASLCARASPLGLLSEQIDPSTGEFIGNYPQAFSHIGVIASGVTLARARTRALA